MRALDYLDVERDGNVVIARTDTGAAQRIVLAGHLDTVPIAANVPSRRDGMVLHGCGTSDMKSGVAVMLRTAASLRQTPSVYDLTYVFYDCEEIEAARNGLGRLARTRPTALQADLAIVLEPTNGGVEAGCQGTLRAEITLTGTRAHSCAVVAWAQRDSRGRSGLAEAGRLRTSLRRHRRLRLSRRLVGGGYQGRCRGQRDSR